MKNVRAVVSSILIFILAALSVLLFAACSSETTAGKFLVYYINDAGDNIVYREWEIEQPEELSCLQRTEILLDRMFNVNMEEAHLHSAKPEEVKINEFAAADNQLTFDFNSAYLNMTNVEEILLRAALVLTMIQQQDVMQVSFTVEGQPLTDSTGEVIGSMQRDNFVDILLNEEGMLKQETDLTVFFTDETGTKLIPAMYHFTISNSNTSMEEYILQQLKAGPAIDSTYRTMAEDVEILSVVTRGTICTVNFGGNFLDQNQPVSDDIMIYSIVNSLCELYYVDAVQFLVEGRSDVVLHTVTDLSLPFYPDKTLEQ